MKSFDGVTDDMMKPHLNLATKISEFYARKWKCPNRVDDFYCLALQGVAEALKLSADGNLCDVSTLVYRRAKFAVVEGVRRRPKGEQVESVAFGDGDGECPEPPAADGVEAGENADRKLVLMAIREMSGPHAKLLILNLGLGGTKRQTLAALAEKAGISMSVMIERKRQAKLLLAEKIAELKAARAGGAT